MEIEKLNSIINILEAEMLRLKHQYELAVENRNFMGLQLIERNDELCILYERANVQEATLKKGRVNLTSREAELRMLKLELKEANRQIEVSWPFRVLTGVPAPSTKPAPLVRELFFFKIRTFLSLLPR